MTAHYLLDANILVALAWPNHQHHRLARAWFAQRADEGWATCAITQLAFLRVSSSPALPGQGAEITEAASALAVMVEHPAHEFWPVGPPVLDLRASLLPHLTGYRQLTDAYLLALATQHSARLVTMDRGLAVLAQRFSDGAPVTLLSS